MSALDATRAADQAVQQMLAQQVAKQLLASAKPADGGDADGTGDASAPYQDQFANVLADALTAQLKAGATTRAAR